MKNKNSIWNMKYNVHKETIYIWNEGDVKV